MKRGPAALPTFELAEWQTRLVPGEALTPADLPLKQELEAGEEGRLVIDELRSGVRITARSWVGVVRFERFEVRIVPKLAGDNIGLVQMIEFATGLDALRRNSGARELNAQEAGLLDLVALLLVEGAESILRSGLLADYVELEDDLPVVRGRLLGDLQVLKRFGQVDRLACRFDEHETNIVENQLLAAALAHCATRVSHELVRGRVRRALAIFSEVCTPQGLDLAASRERLTYHRLNEHYRHSHDLAWLVLDGLGTKDVLAPGQTRCFAFLIDMNRLFEKFVFRLVDTLMSRSEMHVRYQFSDRSIIVDAATNQPYARVTPDLLVEPGPGRSPLPRLAVDAKYKLYDERKLSSGDVYQGFVYAYAYGQGGGAAVPTALLLYPSSTPGSQAVRLRIQSAQKLLGAEILALGVSIPAAIAEISTRRWGPATTALIEGIRQGLGLGRPPRSRSTDAERSSLYASLTPPP